MKTRLIGSRVTRLERLVKEWKQASLVSVLVVQNESDIKQHIDKLAPNATILIENRDFMKQYLEQQGKEV